MMTRMLFRRTRLLGPFTVAACLAMAACSGGEAVQKTPAPSGRGGGQGGAVPVTTAVVSEKPMPLDVRGIGTVIAASTVSVRAQITGELTSVHFKEGEDVEDGQVLVRLDRRPLEAALHQASPSWMRTSSRRPFKPR